MSNLLKETYALLRKTKQTRQAVATGADVGFDWLQKFAGGQITDPGVKRTQRLHDYLQRETK